MKKEKILSSLEDIAAKLNLKVRQEKGDFAGGYCVKDDTEFILLNKRHMIDRRINILAREVSKFDVSTLDVPKAVLEIIESERKHATADDLELAEEADD